MDVVYLRKLPKVSKSLIAKKNTIVCTYINNIKEVIISKGVNKILSW